VRFIGGPTSAQLPVVALLNVKYAAGSLNPYALPVPQ